MGSVRVVTDGGADLPVELAERLAVRVVQGPIQFGSEAWEGPATEFWRRVRSGSQVPATAPPSAAAFGEAFEGDDPVCAVTVSGEFSGTDEHARQAAARMRCPVEVVDSRSMSVGTGLVALVVAEAARAGLGLEELGPLGRTLADRTHLHAVIEDVGYLQRGGRAGPVWSRPAPSPGARQLIAVRGHAIPLRQTRDRRRAIRQLLDHIRRDHLGHGADRWVVGHGDAADVDELVARGCEVFGSPPAFVVLLGASVGTHAGPGSVVVALVSRR